jgi:hypothetical protein
VVGQLTENARGLLGENVGGRGEQRQHKDRPSRIHFKKMHTLYPTRLVTVCSM